jgi:hypothetical protein
MARMYDRVNGKKLEKLIALTQEAQDGLKDETKKIGRKAEALLSETSGEGHAFIETDHDTGKVDHYVVLNDERGLLAALSIEYGRKAQFYDIESGEEAGAMEGLFILHRAAGLTPKDGGE